MRFRARRGRGDAHHGDGAARAGQTMQALRVVVAVQHQFGAAASDDFLEGAGVVQPAQRPRAAAMWRMMQHDDARETFRSVRSSSAASRAHWSGPSRPEATNGAVGTPDESPINATPSRRRR